MSVGGNSGLSSVTEIYDPLSEASHEDPYPQYAVLREEYPLYQIRKYGVWVLSRYADVRDTLRDWETFSSAQGVEMGEYVQFFGDGSIQELDPPHHDTVRRVIAPRFQAKTIKHLEEIIREIAEHLIDRFVHLDHSDLAVDFTQALPIATIFRLLGVPEKDVSWAMECGLKMLRRPAGEAGPSPIAMQARADLVDYLEEGVRQRRGARNYGEHNDVLSDIAVAIDAGIMSEGEIQGLALLLIAAGMETTSGLMGNMAYAVAKGEVSAQESIDPQTGVVTLNAIEEFLRHDSPAQWLARVTTRPVELHGTLLPKGSRVLVLFASANRDHREFHRPDERILTRDQSRHISFGEGVHFCLGRPLALLETRIGMTALLHRVPSFVAAGAPVRYPSHVIRGFESVPVTLG